MDDVKSSWFLRVGLQTYYNGDNNGSQCRKAKLILKSRLSSDCPLQLEGMKLESLVMAHQLRRREYVPGSCTHRLSNHESRFHPKSVV